MLVNLPIELIWVIWARIESTCDKNALIRTCRRFYYTFNTNLYRHVGQSKDKTRKAMIWAALNGRETCMHRLLDHGADPGVNDVSDVHRDNFDDGYLMYSLDSHELEDEDMSMSTPLACAAQRGHSGVAKLLIDAGVNVNAHGGLGDLPIIWAVGQGHAEVLTVLLGAGASTRIEVGSLGTLLAYAAEYGHTEIVRLLLAKDDRSSNNVSWEQSEIEDALVYAIRYGREEVVRVIIEAGTDINSPINGNRTPLHVAGADGSENMVNLLLDLGANIETPDCHGMPPLHGAIMNGHFVTVMALLDRGASIETRNRIGFTPLAEAVFFNHPEVVKVLLERNADIEARDDEGDTPLLLAARFGSTSSVRALLERGADPNVTDKHGYTPLCLAVQGRHVGVVMALLNDDDTPPETWNYHSGRSWESPPRRSRFIDTPDPFNRTPLFLATIYGSTEIVRLLLSRGSNAIQIPACTGRTPLSVADANKDKRPALSRSYDKLQFIFKLLQNPSKAAVDMLLVQNASRSEPDEEEYRIVECKMCFAPISDYDESSICDMCKDEYGNLTGVCPECRATGKVCHVTDLPVKEDL